MTVREIERRTECQKEEERRKVARYLRERANAKTGNMNTSIMMHGQEKDGVQLKTHTD